MIPSRTAQSSRGVDIETFRWTRSAVEQQPWVILLLLSRVLDRYTFILPPPDVGIDSLNESGRNLEKLVIMQGANYLRRINVVHHISCG